METKHLQSIADLMAEDLELEAIKMLMNSLQRKMSIVSTEKAYAKAQLEMIRKINAGKNETIDALCELEKLDERAHKLNRFMF